MTIYEDAHALIHSDDPKEVREELDRLRAHAYSRPEDAIAWQQFGSALDFTDHGRCGSTRERFANREIERKRNDAPDCQENHLLVAGIDRTRNDGERFSFRRRRQ